MRRLGLAFVVVWATLQAAHAGSLATVTPAGASVGVVVSIIGSGFDPAPANDLVTFTPTTGSPVTAAASSVGSPDPTTGLRRLTVIVPNGLPTGTAALRVRNSVSGEVSQGKSLEIVQLSLPDTRSAAPGGTNIVVRIAGSPNSQFVTGATRVTMGAGITIASTIVESPTSVRATLNVAANAVIGARDVGVLTSTQTALLPGGFSVAAPVVNQAPVVSAGQNQTVTLPSGAALAGSVADDGLPAGGTLTSSWTQVSGPGVASFGNAASPATTATFSLAGTYVLKLTASDSALSSSATVTITVNPAPNHTPTITSQPPTTATEGAAYAYTVAASDADGDPLTFRLVTAPAGMSIASGGAILWTPAAAQTGPQNVVVEVADNRGGSDRQSYTIAVAAAVKLTGIKVTPEVLRFSEVGVNRTLTVTGSRSDGTTVDLTQIATTYESASPFVASVDANGVVRSIANGTAHVTVRNEQFSDAASVVVESGVALQSLELTPANTTLRSAGAAVNLTLVGHFSNDEARDLTTAEGTVFQSSDSSVATVSSGGEVTAASNGVVTIVGRSDSLTAQAQVRVAVSSGSGFLRGEVFDDGRGLPLDGASAAVVVDGGGPIGAPAVGAADNRGRYVLSARAGDGVVRVTRPGFTSVERTATIQASGAVTLLDARLTAIDARPNVIPSAFGGQARDDAGRVTLVVPPGGLGADTEIRLTSISGQGLQGMLPSGWSPVSAVDISPGGLVFGQAAALTLPNAAGLAAASEIVVASYSVDQHAWIAEGTARVSADGRTIAFPVRSSGQIVCLAADGPPFAPPDPQIGNPLAGIQLADLPASVTATGEVVPRSAPPGDQARAIGRILLRYTGALPSGSIVQTRVTERFDLLDQSQIEPESFTEDIVLYARGRPPGDGVLGASFPITPSRSFTIQELLHGVVALDVRLATNDSGATIVGAAGGTVTDADGDALEIPAAALATETVFGLRRVAPGQTTAAAPVGFDAIAAVAIDLVGVTLSQPARLSMAVPATIGAGDQILVAAAFLDPAGTRRLRIVGTAMIENGRIASQTTVGGLGLAGAIAGGEYVFLRSQQPIGFVAGRVTSPDGTTPRPQALVTSDTAPFADSSAADGRFVVAGRAGADATVRAFDQIAHDVATRLVHIDARDAVVAADLTLSVVVPSVSSTSPAANATGVPLDSPVIVDFSEAIDAATITDATVSLRAGAAAVTSQRTLSSDRRRLVLRPSAPLQGKTVHTLTIAGVKNLAGRSLAAFAPVQFTTLDPSKPSVTATGSIQADLPDENGMILIAGAVGVSEGSGAVTVTNLRTQEAVTVTALADGSFHLQVGGLVGDQLAVTLRDSGGRETTISLTQLESADGAVGIGDFGGTVHGAGGRVGNILPRALTEAGVFRIDSTASTDARPALPDGLAYADAFTFGVNGAQFNRLASLTLTEGQNRFPSQAATSRPFEAEGDLTVPSDFLVSASLRFTATAQDASGVSRTVSASTVVVANSPDTAVAEAVRTEDFPIVFVDAPKQALQNQSVHVEALAPTARVDLDLPAPANIESAATLLLVRAVTIGDEPKLAVVDMLQRVDRDGTPRLQTTGRGLPGLSSGGDYSIVASRDPLVFISGRLAGGAAVATVDGLPFISETDGINGSFALPTRAGQPYTLRYFSLATNALLGSTSGNAPSSGGADVGQPLAPVTTQLGVVVEPGAGNVVDIGTPITFRFSEAVDAQSLTTGIVVSDDAGSRVFGATSLSGDGLVGTFKPTRRWRYGTTYRWGVATTVVARSGARLPRLTSGEFTIFSPRLVNTTATAAAHDVAANGALAAVATDAGVTLLDISSPVAPATRAQVALTGGARGIAFLPATSFTDRSGTAHVGVFAVVADGDASGSGRVDVFDVTNPAAPSSIGSAQVTTAPGQTPPANVPGAPGTPIAVVASPGTAVVAVQDVGVESIHVADAVPADAANPGRAVSARYPASAFESVNQAALVGDRIAIVGATGLVSLKAGTLERLGGVSTSGIPRGVATIPSFSMDVNGDGIIVSTTETFDVAAVANGDDTLQFYKVPATGDPVLMSVIHVTGATTSSVTLDATERLAYVGLGSRGVAVVDLDGPASVQPIDVDRNGVDDRILGIVDTPGDAGRIALVGGRGIALVADGPAGVTTLQLVPARSKFLTLLRDPVKVVPAEEESILESPTAYVTDDALQVTLDVLPPPGESLVLTIDEGDGGGRLLSFAAGGTIATLSDGLNDLEIDFDKTVTATSHPARLTVRKADGAVVSAVSVDLLEPDLGTATLRELRLGPVSAVLTDAEPTVRVGVAGYFDDGRVFNLSSPASGTQYETRPAQIATIDPTGLATGLAGGAAAVIAGNGTSFGTLRLQVNRPPVLLSLDADRSFVTLRALGQQVAFPLVATFSDGTQERDLTKIQNVTYTSSDPTIATIGPDGKIVAAGAGVAHLSATSGGLQAAIDLAVDPRTPTVITGITLSPSTAPLHLEDAPLFAAAVIAGTGSLDGLPITVVTTRGSASTTTTTSTDLTGGVDVELDNGAFAGTVAVTASVVDPASGQTRSASQTYTIAAATTDAEPNDNPSSAPTLRTGRGIDGAVGGPGDPQDSYRIESGSDGTLEVDLRLLNGSLPQNAVLVVRDAAGNELARVTPTTASSTFSIQVPAGAAFVTIEAPSGPLAYRLATRFTQADVAVASIAPMVGSAGTVITINGSGFSTRLDDNQVFFSGITAEVVAATSTQLLARVPANAVNGSVEVVSGDRRVEVPGFSTGVPTPRPAAFVSDSDPAAVRRDPSSGALLDITRLIVMAAPAIGAPAMSDLATRVGGTVVAYVPMTNQYVLEFAQNRTLDGLNALRLRVFAEPGVQTVAFYQFNVQSAPPSSIDVFDSGGTWDDFNGPVNDPNRPPRASALDQIHLREAIELVRDTPPFTDRSGLHDVRVAVLDSGFDPGGSAGEFKDLSGHSFVDFWRRSCLSPVHLFACVGPFQTTTAYTDLDGHGTAVASIIGARNDDDSILSGVLNSLVDKTEEPFHLAVYDVAASTPRHTDPAKEIAALDHIRFGVGADVINMSFGGYVAQRNGNGPVTCPNGSDLGPAIRAMRGLSLIVAASGNDGVEARCFFPSAYESTEPHVIGIGAVAVADLDHSGEGQDQRAVFNFGAIGDDSARFFRCNENETTKKAGSNCDPGVTLTAPGEDILALKPGGYTMIESGLRGQAHAFGGTSAAAPIVAGVAAILQAIRPTSNPLPPSRVRSILTSTATDVSSGWGPRSHDGHVIPTAAVLRVDAQTAVESLLPLDRSSTVYVAVEDGPSGVAGQGSVVAVPVDPLTGHTSPSADTRKAISLTVHKLGAILPAGRPRTMLGSPSGKFLYVYISTESRYGDGIAVISTASGKAVDFIPLSGMSFPSNSTTPRAFKSSQQRPPMAISRDGRLLYVSTGQTLRVISLVPRRIVRHLADLPAPYNVHARDSRDLLQFRLDRLEELVGEAGSTPAAGSIQALELSPEGNRLYVIVRSGIGPETQPGFVYLLDVDLYKRQRDLPPGAHPLDDYLQVSPHLGIQDGSSRTQAGSDEPGGSALSPDGRYLYVVNGGEAHFTAVNPAELAFTYSLKRDSSGLATDPNLIDDSLAQDFADEIRDQKHEGGVVLDAPGVVDVFDTANTFDSGITSATTRYVSDINFPWLPSHKSGGLVLSPLRFGGVFAKRPMDIAMRPDGLRALVAYYQTGNFGVLDHEGQKFFKNANARNGFAANGFFTGVTAVTPALSMDRDLQPNRESTTEGFITSPDERLLFPVQIEYAQNGRFAAAIHTGRIAAGALSLIEDQAITDDVLTHATVDIQETDFTEPRSYFSARPVCLDDLSDQSSKACTQSATTAVYDYTSSRGVTPLTRPIGLAIAPILAFTSPAFGDEVGPTTPIALRWPGAGVTRLVIEVFDATNGSSPALVGHLDEPLPVDQHTETKKLAELLTGPQTSGPKLYVIRASVTTASDNVLASTVLFVTYLAP